MTCNMHMYENEHFLQTKVSPPSPACDAGMDWYLWYKSGKYSNSWIIDQRWIMNQWLTMLQGCLIQFTAAEAVGGVFAVRQKGTTQGTRHDEESSGNYRLFQYFILQIISVNTVALLKHNNKYTAEWAKRVRRCFHSGFLSPLDIYKPRWEQTQSLISQSLRGIAVVTVATLTAVELRRLHNYNKCLWIIVTSAQANKSKGLKIPEWSFKAFEDSRGGAAAAASLHSFPNHSSFCWNPAEMRCYAIGYIWGLRRHFQG